MDEDSRLDDTGAFAWKPLLDPEREPPPEEFSNPPGVSRGDCDAPESGEHDETCDLEVTAQVEDMVLGETMPGYGIPGFDAEEDGGG